MTRDYPSFPALSDLYLENSWVLEISEAPDSLSFRVDAVLTEDNPRYHTPYPNEQYCYAHLWISFTAASAIDWIEYHPHPTTDPNGEVDYGNIDTLVYNENRYELQGDWGIVYVYCKADPTVTYLESTA